VVASVVGLAAGIGVAAGLKQLLSGFGLDLPAGGLAVTTSTVATALVVGTGVTLASAYFPARKAGRVPPIAAMRAVAVDRTGASPKRMVIGGVATAAGVGALLVGLRGEALPMVGAGALVTFIGVAVLAPVLARPAARVLGYPMHKMSRMSGSLARQNAMRNPKRTAATAAALMIGVALVGFIATFAASTKQSINTAVDKDFDGNYVIDSGSSGPGTGGLSHQLALQIAARPEFAAVTSLRNNSVELDGSANQLVSWDTATVGTMLDFDTVQGDSTAMGVDGIAVLDTFADEHHLQLGSSVPVVFAQGDVSLTVKAIYGNAMWVGDAFVDHAVADRLGVDQLDTAVLVALADGVTPKAGEVVLDEMTAAYPTADVLDREGFKEANASDIDLILNLIYALLALAILIALMGITNTLALSIFERTRELGLLRAVGMTRSQLRSTVRFEAMIIAVFGTLLGLGIGVSFGWSIVQALSDQGIDQLVVPIPTLVIVTTVAALAGVLASVLPARRAAKLDMLAAIATS
jgi:putative ABC transport system permease protein